MNLLALITYSGTFVFALTGALKAKAFRMDIFGAAVLAFVSAYGGGTVRDLLIGIRPVNWVNDYLALSLVIAAVLMVFLFAGRFHKLRKVIFVTDAIGLGLFTVAGIQVSLQNNLNNSYAIVMGVITATFGGLLADVLSNTVPDLLKRGEIYATASLIGGIIYIFLLKNNIDHNTGLAITVIIIVLIRIISKIKRLMLPEI